MRKVKIDAKEVLDDLRKGVSDNQLMLKYGLSVRGLNSLMNKLQQVLIQYDSKGVYAKNAVDRRVSARDIVSDIRSGLDCHDLMGKYRLSENAVQTVFSELKSAGLPVAPKRRIKVSQLVSDIHSGLTEPELMEKYCISLVELKRIASELTRFVTVEDFGGLDILGFGSDHSWLYPAVSLNVYDVMNPEVIGSVRRIRSDGFGLTGICSALEELKIVVIYSEDFQYGKPLIFDAECILVANHAAFGNGYAEFKIVNAGSCILKEYKGLLSAYTLASVVHDRF